MTLAFHPTCRSARTWPIHLSTLRARRVRLGRLTAPADGPFTIDLHPAFFRLDPEAVAESQAHALGLDVDIKLGTVHLHFKWSAIPLRRRQPNPRRLSIPMDNIVQDIRYAVRMCVRTPGFTAIAVAALALGIGANTAIFTVVNAVLIERLPFRDPGRLVAIWENNTRNPRPPNTIAPANFLQWRDRATAFERMSAFYDFTGT